jgi:hypothetical protein
MREQDYARQIRMEDLEEKGLEGLDDSWSDDSVGDGCGTAR